MAGERGANKSPPGDDDKEGAGITIEVLQQHFHQPLVTVADELGVSLTVRVMSGAVVPESRRPRVGDINPARREKRLITRCVHVSSSYFRSV